MEFHVENGQSKYRLHSLKENCKLSAKCPDHIVYR